MLNFVAPTQTIVYNYGNSSWTDLLTSYNGKNITYDAIGNPTAYLGYTLKWNGRQLSSLSGNGVTASYKYDADGLRSYKKVNGVETTFQYVGDKLMYEKRGTTEFYYYYNSFGNLAGIRYVLDGTQYVAYVICNSRGDVEDLYWASGNLACHYTYDSWGNVISITDANGKEITNANHIGLLNPFRYRGYYYDSETGMYYLQSRYYNPQVGRFINVDGAYDTNQGILGYNMYAYCLNNPVNMYDPDGRCSRFLGFLWKIDCKQASCSTSKNYVKPKAIDPIGSYNKGQGYVYVVTEDQLSIMEEREKNVVVIIDKRSPSSPNSNYDPNMQIQASYRITKNKQKKEIAQLMLDYNVSNPVTPAWNRSLDSLVKEWEIHNTIYALGLYRSHTADCDFNNGDEGKGYWDFFVERVLK